MSPTDQPAIRVDVSAAIIKDNKVLLMLRPKDDRNYPLHWGVPGGGFELTDESLEMALRREVREEVGIEIDNIRLVASNFLLVDNVLFINFVADYASGEIVPQPEEVAEAGWFGLAELDGKLFTPTTEALLRKILS